MQSDVLSSDWLAPDGTVISGVSWETDSGSFCFDAADLTIPNIAGALGSWQARVYDNGTLLFSVPFQVTSSSSAPPAAGSITSVGSSAPGVTAVAPGSLAVVSGANLAAGALKAVSGSSATSLGRFSVQVGGKAAAVQSVSATQLFFVVPADVSLGKATVTIALAGATTNSTLTIQNTAPGLYTYPAASTRGAIKNAATSQLDPFFVQTPENSGSDKRTRLLIYATGLRYAGNPKHDPPQQNAAAAVQVQAWDGSGNQWNLPVESVTPEPNVAGEDQIQVVVPAELDGAGTISLQAVAESNTSNQVALTIGSTTAPAVTQLSVTNAPPGAPITVSGTNLGGGDSSTGLARTVVIFNLDNGQQLQSSALSSTAGTIEAIVPLAVDTDGTFYQRSAQVCVMVDSKQSVCASQPFTFAPLVQPAGQLGDTLIQSAQQTLQASVDGIGANDPATAAALQNSGSANIQELQGLIQQLRAGGQPAISYIDLNGHPATGVLDAKSLAIMESFLSANPLFLAESTGAAGQIRSRYVAHAEGGNGCAPLDGEEQRVRAKETVEKLEKSKKFITFGGYTVVAGVTLAACATEVGCIPALEAILPTYEKVIGAASTLIDTTLFFYESSPNYLSKLQTPVDADVAIGESKDFQVNAEFTKIYSNSLTAFLAEKVAGDAVYVSSTELSHEISKAIASFVSGGITLIPASQPNFQQGTATIVELGGSSLTLSGGGPEATITLACAGSPSKADGKAQTNPDANFTFTVDPKRFLTVTPVPYLNGHIDVTVQSNVARVEISPRGGSLPVGDTLQLSAAAFDDGNKPVPVNPANLVWTASGAASVDSNGLVTAGKTPGTAQITVTEKISNHSDSVTINVVLGTIDHLTLTSTGGPPISALPAGQGVILQVTAYDRANNVISVPASQFTWTVLPPSGVITLSLGSTGASSLATVMAVATGTATVDVMETTSKQHADAVITVVTNTPALTGVWAGTGAFPNEWPAQIGLTVTSVDSKNVVSGTLAVVCSGYATGDGGIGGYDPDACDGSDYRLDFKVTGTLSGPNLMLTGSGDGSVAVQFVINGPTMTSKDLKITAGGNSEDISAITLRKQ